MQDDLRTILCFGDSNTHGTLPMGGRLGPGARWPGVMAGVLGDGWRVVEEGLPGRTTVHPDPIEGVHKNGLAALPILLESHLPLDVVVVMLGTNDLKARFAVGPEDIAAGAGRVALAVRRSEAGPSGGAPAVLLVAPPPILEVGELRGMFRGGAAKSEGLAACFAAEAARLGVAFFDAGRVIRSSGIDGIHFDAGEHAKLGRAVAGAVRGLQGR
ncbi:MAG: SGNH/GDSL hydrolase family protein [Geminicoccaceae bacterium]|nr:SGNH/GDSL hydrolase family protein [Geminicoccaceae bacterium]